MPLSITTQLIVEAAERRNWKVEVLNEETNFIQVTTNDDVYYLRNCRNYKGSGVNDYITNSKDIFSRLAGTIDGIRLPAEITITDSADTVAFIEQYKKVVVKPANLAHGEGITIDITNHDALIAAIQTAKAAGATTVIVQQQVDGDDYRVLAIDGKIEAAAIRVPATVIGDGQHNLGELIVIENRSPNRGERYTKRKCFIDEASAKQYLADKINDIPQAGEDVRVVGVANIGRGGVAIDVTDTISDTIAEQTHALINRFKLGLAGVDFIVDSRGDAYLIEVNTSPSFGLHAYPVSGSPRLVADPFWDWVIK